MKVATYGAVLAVIGVTGYFGAGMLHWTALIPAILGGIALLFAIGPVYRKRPASAAIAGVAVAALALFGTVGSIPELPLALSGDPAVNVGAVLSRAATAIVSVVLLLLLVADWMRSRSSGAPTNQ